MNIPKDIVYNVLKYYPIMDKENSELMKKIRERKEIAYKNLCKKYRDILDDENSSEFYYLRWLENDIVRWMNNDKGLKHELTDKYVGIMNRMCKGEDINNYWEKGDEEDRCLEIINSITLMEVRDLYSFMQRLHFLPEI
tara:strand:+ start:1156 stop:1572 length:417 start_codon:yes stop_codon:yes gene_type:complete